MTRNILTRKVCVGLFVFFLTLFVSFASFADPGNPWGDDCGLSPDDQCPIDTWVYVLFATALIFGAYKLHTRQKQISL